MKVGIITLHRATNYGTALQAVASLYALMETGVEAELIDYRPDHTERTMRLMSLSDIHSVKNMLTYCAELVFRRRTQKQKIKEFEEFLAKVPTSEPIYDTDTLAKAIRKYDIVVTGSDQIWNPVISEGDMSYFLPFEHKRKVSFSSSFGVTEFPAELTEKIAGYLEDFEAITVREATAARYIRRMIDDGHKIPEPKTILDPTLFFGKDWWLERAEEAKLPKDGYILVYYLLPSPLIDHATEKIRRETGLPVLNIRPSKLDIIKRSGSNIAASGPAKFINYLAGASYIVTNSFHGTAFSLNFEKPFVAVTLPEKRGLEINSRITDLLELTGMSHRRATTNEEIDRVPLEVDFTDARAKLAAAREDSWELLKTLTP